jgi:hypothetical protein
MRGEGTVLPVHAGTYMESVLAVYLYAAPMDSRAPDFWISHREEVRVDELYLIQPR